MNCYWNTQFTKFVILLPLVGIAGILAQQNPEVVTRGGEERGDLAVKPRAMGSIRYVAAAGNDANDGLSWGTAKLTWDGACISLPGGTASPPTCGSGEIAIMGTVAANANPDCGRWLMGSADPNYASPPICWYRYPPHVGIKTTCSGTSGFGPHGASADCVVSGGSQNKVGYPGLWISAVADGFEDDHIAIANYVLTPIRLGIASNEDRNGVGGVSGIRLNGVSQNLGNCVRGGGPGIDIGSNSFWIYIEHPTVSGCIAEDYSSSFYRSGGVVTATTSSTNDFIAGTWVTIKNSTDTSFNGSFIVTGVSGSPQTQVTWSQAGPNARSASGEMFNWRSAAIAVNPGSGSGSGLVFVSDPVFSDGGVWFASGVNGGGIYIHHANMEGNPTGPSPPGLLMVRPATEGGVDGYEVSDVRGFTPAVEIDNGCTQRFSVTQVDYVWGCTTVSAVSPRDYAGYSPLAQGQFGVVGNQIIGQTNAAARQFSPISVRWPNIAIIRPGDWTFSNGTGKIATGVAAPDGTANAATVTAMSSPNSFVQFFKHDQASLTIGDYYIFSGWVQSANGTATATLELHLEADGYGTGDSCGGGQIMRAYAPYIGNSEWFHVYGACRITANPSPAGLLFGGNVYQGRPTTFFAPTLIHIPASNAVSYDEATEIAMNLQSYDPSCVSGDTCGLPGHTLIEDKVALKPGTLSALGPCSVKTEGKLGSVNDSNTDTWGATITAGSLNLHVLAYCDGKKWTVAGK